jgi:Spy/CpxP family protein refolding chaperone
MKTWTTRFALAALVFAPFSVIRADDAPAQSAAAASTRPDVPPAVPEGLSGRIANMIQRDRMLLQNINLTDSQKNQVDTIYVGIAKQVQGMVQELSNMEGPQRFQRFRQVINDAHTQIMTVLSDDQKGTYQDNLSRFREQLRQRMAAGGFNQNTAVNPLGPPTGQSMVDRLRAGVAKINLTDDQKTQVKSIVDELSKNMKPLEEEWRSSPETARDKSRDFFADAREKLQAILTPDQQSKLRAFIRQSPSNDDAKPRDEAKPRDDAKPQEKSSLDNAPGEKMAADKKIDADNSMEKMTAGARPRVAVKPRPAIAEAPVTPLVKAGQAAPDFTLKQLDGSTATLSSYKDHVLVLIFGSLTTPTFRDRAPALSDLAKEYGTKANFLVVYTKESHPAGGWEVERNKQDHIKIDQPRTETDRIGVAKRAREILKLNLPFAVDSDIDATATAYGTFPSGAVIIGRDGTIAYAQQWCDPSILRRHLDEILNAKMVAAGK